jgi:hypothetical protein
VRVAVDEAGDRRQPAAVDLLDMARESEIGHAPDRGDPSVAEHEGAPGTSTSRRAAPQAGLRGRRERPGRGPGISSSTGRQCGPAVTGMGR